LHGQRFGDRKPSDFRETILVDPGTPPGGHPPGAQTNDQQRFAGIDQPANKAYLLPASRKSALITVAHGTAQDKIAGCTLESGGGDGCLQSCITRVSRRT
jgi:hypothetical protein